MTGTRKDVREELQRLMSAIADDLTHASEQEISEDIVADGRNPTDEAEAVKKLIEEAAKQCGKDRLAAAKDAVKASKNENRSSNVSKLEASVARRQLTAVVKQRGISLAARNESQLSDDDVRSTLDDLEELGILPDGKGADNKS